MYAWVCGECQRRGVDPAHIPALVDELYAHMGWAEEPGVIDPQSLQYVHMWLDGWVEANMQPQDTYLYDEAVASMFAPSPAELTHIPPPPGLDSSFDNDTSPTHTHTHKIADEVVRAVIGDLDDDTYPQTPQWEISGTEMQYPYLTSRQSDATNKTKEHIQWPTQQIHHIDTNHFELLQEEDFDVEENEQDADEQVYECVYTHYPRLSSDALMCAVAMAEGDVFEALRVVSHAEEVTASCRPCRHAIQGGCYRSDCRFDHNLKDIPCKYWLHGECSNDSTACVFMHDLVPSKTGPTTTQTPKIQASTHTYLHGASQDFPALPTRSTQSSSRNSSNGTQSYTPDKRSMAAELFSSLFEPTADQASANNSIPGSNPDTNGGSYRDIAIRAAAIPANIHTDTRANTHTPFNASHIKQRGVFVAGGENVRRDYVQLRDRAREAAIARNTLYMEACKAFIGGAKSQAKALSQRAKDMNRQMKSLHAEAALALFRKRNSADSVSGGVIDVHGLHVAECRELICHLLDHLDEGHIRNPNTLDIITGSGHHARGSGNKPRLLPQLRCYLQEELGYQTRDIRDSNGHIGGLRLILRH